ncbi:LysR substrate-binding domain-containing protein [Entomobacter blattae]|uniref:HTH-type transcriptional regulator PgrR n=1 Tax=Entomobacter blattae TaxID=2762277 RepID=A0A7H1NS73_9PROT|nr:LysR substrate-binding domain-containing protein [Entomobacter blattae]QNT78633.1 HTH-type transcriptional regulator PgrR [Entomobacter blattae]
MFTEEGSLSGQLRVDMPTALATLLVVPHLPSFYTAHPNIEIELSGSDRRRNLLRDGLDCVLRVGALEDSDYIVRNMGNIAMTTCASPEYLARYGMPETLEDLHRHKAVNWINRAKRQVVPWMFQTEERVVELYLKSQLVLDNSEVYVAAGLAGIGILQGLNIFLQPHLESGALVEVLPHNPVPPRQLSLLYPHRNLSQKVRILPIG